MTTKQGFPGVPKMLPDEMEHRRQLAQMLNDRVNRGKFNCTISLTLTANAVSTNLIDERIGNGSFLDFMPLTANAATAKTGIYVSNQLNGSCTINHASSANVDQTFKAVILG